MDNSRTLTNEEYTALKGTYCPFCQSRDIEAGQTLVHGTKAFQTVICYECLKFWDDVYDLVGYEDTN